jgi:hypothetical protein
VVDASRLVACRSTTLTIWDRPRTSTSALEPDSSSMRATLPAGMRFSSSDAAVLELGRSPLTSRLPAVAPNPRRSSPSFSSKPGIRATMSAAVTGLY